MDAKLKSAPSLPAGHSKPSLSVDEQINQLKSQGVTFNLVTEDEAADYLARANNYLRARSYRVLYPRRPDGTYIGLDFRALMALSSVDRQLRAALLGTCIDVEHFARVKLLACCDEHDEDGYAVIEDYLTSLASDGRRRVRATLDKRGGDDERRDEYTGDLIEHYLAGGTGLPIWVFLEVVDFGRFSDLWRSCTGRWNDPSMEEVHYVLKFVKSLRNACAHNSEIINGLRTSATQHDYSSDAAMLRAMNAAGIPNNKSRRVKLRNLRVQQIASTLYLSDMLCRRPATRARHATAMRSVRDSFDRLRPLCPANGSLTSYLDFIFKLVDIWLPERA